MNIFLPNRKINNIFELDVAFFHEEGIRGIVIDLDNTLVAWNVKYAPEEVEAWLKRLQEAGIKITICSNNDENRVKTFAKPLNIPYIYRAKKPLQGAFIKAAKKMGTHRGQLAVIGDQLLTDMLGGNLYGAYTILVDPIVPSDAPVTKFNRFIEQMIIRYFIRKGIIIRGVSHDR